MKRKQWDYAVELDQDRQVENLLPVKEFFVFVIVAAVVAIRIFLG